MQKVERRLSKTLLKMSKKFLSLEEDIQNISCEGIIYILFTMEEEIPLYNLESKGHNDMLKKKVKKFRKSEFLTDLYITCMDGMVSMHKMLLLQKIPYFSQYLCEICDHHSATFLILPDVTKNELEKEVRNLYSYGIVSGLEVLFGFKKSYHHQKQSEPQHLDPQVNEQRSLV